MGQKRTWTMLMKCRELAVLQSRSLSVLV